MTKENIENKVKELKLCKDLLLGYIAKDNELLEKHNEQINDLEKQLAEQESMETYNPIFLIKSGLNYAITKNGTSGSDFEKYIEQHNAGEEFKQRLSKLNNGWFPDWKNLKQGKKYLYYDYGYKRLCVGFIITLKNLDDYEYFNPTLENIILEDTELLDLFKIWKEV